MYVVKFFKEKIVLEEYADFEKGALFSVLDFSVYISDKKLRWILRNSFEKGEVIVTFPNIYYKVKMNNFFPDKIFSPDIVHALKALTKRTGQKFQEEGGRAANLLGLSTQVPLIEEEYQCLLNAKKPSWMEKVL